MMQLCVCKEGGRRNRGGNRSRSLGHQPAVEPAILPPTAPSSLTLFLHPSMPFVPPVRCVTSSRTSRRSLQLTTRASVAFKFFKQCQLAYRRADNTAGSPLTMFTVPCTRVYYSMYKSCVIPYSFPLSTLSICLLHSSFTDNFAFSLISICDINFLITLFIYCMQYFGMILNHC